MKNNKKQSKNEGKQSILATTTPPINEKKIKKKAKFRPKVMNSSPMTRFPSSPGSGSVSSSCKRVLNFGCCCEVVNMMIFTKSGFRFNRKVCRYIKPIDDNHLLKSIKNNKKKEDEWWKNENELFQRRASSFISATSVVQGNRPFMGWKGSVVDSVVGAFLAQNVADSMSSSVFMSLAAKYPKVDKIIDHQTEHSIDWNAVRCADRSDISRAIQHRGQNIRIATRIQDFLNTIHDNKSGIIDLERLRNAKQQEAIDYFMGVFGLGLKSTACLRLLTLRQRAFPVDTHVSRIVVRLGWVPVEKLPDGVQLHQLTQYPSMDRVQEYLSPRLSNLDEKTLYELHYQMITFGKVFCTKKKPKCNNCPLKKDCKHFASACTPSNRYLELEEKPVRVTNGGPCTPTSYGPALSIASPKLDDIEDLLLGPKVRKPKNAGRSRTEHLVYELPDSHPLLRALDKRDSNDRNPYLLAIWPLGETKNPTECVSVKSNDLRDEETLLFGTLLVPCRTATRGSFPLDGTFFQINEVFSDDESSEKLLVLPKKLLLSLTTKTLSCGTTIKAIFEGMSTKEIQDCFCEGYVCIRGFNMKTREPRPLHQRFHDTLTKKVNKIGKSPRTKKNQKDDGTNN